MKSSFEIVISSIVGFLIFIALLLIANLLSPYINNGVFSSILRFLTSSIGVLAIITLLGLVNAIFWNMRFPFNILAPITSAFLSSYIWDFLVNFWNFFEAYLQTGITIPSELIKLIMFWIVILVGYFIIIFRKLTSISKMEREIEKPIEEKKRLEEKRRFEEQKRQQEMRKGKRISWSDVGNEFKKFFLNIGRSVNSLFKRKKKKP